MAKVAPYGSWASPITADLLVENVVRLSQVLGSGRDVLWNESRPSEGGRQVVVRLRAGGQQVDAIPDSLSARTLVHEYGGASFTAHGVVVFVANFSDQRLWRIGSSGEADSFTAEPITPPPPAPMAWRFADFQATPDGQWLVAVHERHDGQEVLNQVVAVPADGSREPLVLVDGHDFFAAPRVSPDGTRLAWLSWDHPDMPWDATTLWEASLSPDMDVGAPRLVAGGREESVTQPRWSPDGRLHYVSDRTGWWNLYADDVEGGRALAPRPAEFSGPDWVLGQSTYAFLDDGSLVATWSEAGRMHLGVMDAGADTLEAIGQPYTDLSSLAPQGSSVLAIAGSPVEAPAVVRIAIPSGDVEVLKKSRQGSLERGYISEPEAVEFPTEGGVTAHALYYPARNQDFEGPPDERPPLVVMCHGGPTSAASSVLNLGVQYWTSRGLAVADVDYGGSTGYGRPYRERLKGKWGIVDLDDCTNAARWLAQQGEVDGDRLVMRGGSAGGYTTLCALVFRDVFAAGASLYGVADLEALAVETHKFESRYLDGLIGRYPEERQLYLERSPIHHADRLSCPVILFQGAEDKVVPPAQAETFADALRRKGLPFCYLLFEGEQHGFRQAGTIRRVAEAELWFYGKVLGFQPADDLEPAPMENANALRAVQPSTRKS